MNINDHNGKGACTDRLPAFAGRFYPATEATLRESLQKAFRSAKNLERPGLRALIVPHAGYIFSGDVAAHAYAQIPLQHTFRRIFILASSHRTSFAGASVFASGDYLTPLGRVTTDVDLAHALRGEHEVFSYGEQGHAHEHSLEVQLPLLQHHLSSLPPVVPIILGTQSPETCRELAQALRPYFVPENIFIISTDFSHFPAYQDACRLDLETAEIIAANQPLHLLETIRDKAWQHTPGLQTRLCGWTSVLTLMHLTAGNEKLKYHLLQYRNSGDAPAGDRDAVVGYWAMSVNEEGSEDVSGPEIRSHLRHEACTGLSPAEQQKLLEIARQSLQAYLIHGHFLPCQAAQMPPALQQPAGAFVSLHHGKELRGCIGRFDPDIPLYLVVRDMAVSAAQDSRFEPVAAAELEDLEIEITVLGPRERIQGPDDIIIGKHGIYLRQGISGGTLLPQVAVQHGWDAPAFLGHCARDKAGIGWEGWRHAEIYRFEAQVFGEK